MTHDPAEIEAHLFVPSAGRLISSSVLFWFLLLPSLVSVGFGVFACRAVGEEKPEKPLSFGRYERGVLGGAAHAVRIPCERADAAFVCCDGTYLGCS